jgi:hypothetical protein
MMSEWSPPRKCRFCIGDDHVFGYLLSFLSNQSQTKLQLVTGDRYPSCESRRSRCCCACEEDNPALFDGPCSACVATKLLNRPLISKMNARRLYCLEGFLGVSCDSAQQYTPAALDEHALKVFGSHLQWLRRKDEPETFLASLPVAFVGYIMTMELAFEAKTDLLQYNERLGMLATALEQRELELRTDSRLWNQFILSGMGNVERIVDDMEERAFLLKHTAYTVLCRKEIRMSSVGG